MRLVWTFLGLAVLLLIPFLIWGTTFEAHWTRERLIGMGPWAGVIGVALLVGDLLLPAPSTIVMSALGYLYGPITGGLLASLGSFLAGMTGYGLCRLLGQRLAERLVGKGDLERAEALFANYGPWVVAASRWLPLLAEVIACFAGLTRMPIGRFIVALTCGVLPMGFAFAAIGSLGTAHPGLAVVLSAIAPVILWSLVKRWSSK